MIGRLARRMRLGPCGALLCLALALGGCATTGPALQPWPAPGEHDAAVSGVPFYPQERYQCGPAALATVLQWSGVDTDPKALKPYLYIPEREGTLQPEIAAQARRLGRLAYPLQHGPDGMLAELKAGHPVLVLQNNGLSWLPKWHYAVAVGTTEGGRNIVLRSGTIRRHVIGVDVFNRTWRRGSYWGLVILPPGAWPATAEPTPYLQAVNDFEADQTPAAALPAWQAGVRHWPANPALRFAAGNALLALKRPADAEAQFRAGTIADPGADYLWNNLALALANQGRWHAAERAAKKAVAADGDYRQVAEDTLADIRARAEAARQSR